MSRIAKKVEGLVDWTAVRESVKTQIQGHLEEMVKKANRLPALQPAQSEAIKTYVSKQIDEKLTAETFVKDAKKRPGKPDLEKVEITSREWNSATEFTLRTNQSDGKMIFTLAGMSGWKLVDVQLGEEDVKSMLNPPGASPGGVAPGGNALPPGLAPAAPPKPKSWLDGYQNPLDKKPQGNTGPRR